jgi:acyl carrier protein
MSIASQVKQFIVTEFIPGGKMEDIADDMDLINTGIIDSLAVLKTVAFIENEFDVSLDPEEIDTDNLKTIAEIAQLIAKKRHVALRA